MALRDVKLDDKYDLGHSHVFVTGFQALVRLCLMQKELDRRNGLNTAGYVTGYRGSPLGGLDSQFQRAAPFLTKNDIRFQAGINEDLAATAVWGTQQAELRGEGKYDGVFAMWYGKGPGVDRTGDVFRHANLAGTAKNGGVLALMGDDHTAESSTTAHQSEYHFIDVMIPILNPAGVQEVLDYGLYGWAMSRFTGAWVALKTMHETIEFDGGDRRQPRPRQHRHADRLPRCRRAASTSASTIRSSRRKRGCTISSATPCWRSCAPTRSITLITSGGREPKIGIITTGKSYLDVRQALDELGIDEVNCNELGIRLYKVGCPWPISRRELAEFAAGLDLIIVVEEKRSLIEVQVREELYGTANQPVCIGKRDEQGNWLFPVKGALDPNEVAICIGERLLKYHRNDEIAQRVARLKEFQRDRRARRATSRSAFPISVPAARTIPRPWCRKGCAPMPASAAISWRSGWTARRSATRRWAARAPTGSAKRRSPTATTSSRISATAPTIIPATWRSAPRSRRTPTSPTRSCSTTRWR